MNDVSMLLSEIRYLARNEKPKVIFQTTDMVYLREIEDMIAWIFKRKPNCFNYQATRYVCSERDGNRYYYEVQIIEGERRISVLCGDATDYSGHGGHDKILAEFFIQKVLGLRMNEVPASYLIGSLKYELYKLRGVE